MRTPRRGVLAQACGGVRAIPAYRSALAAGPMAEVERHAASHLVADRPVGFVVVLAAEPVVVHPRRMRHPRIERRTAVNAGSARLNGSIVDYLSMPVYSRP